MSAVQPPAPHYTIEDLGDTLRIVIPSGKRKSIGWLHSFNWGMTFIVSAFFSITSGVGLLSQGASLVSGKLPEFTTSALQGELFSLLWFVLWTIGAVLALYAFLWRRVGQETIVITSKSITTCFQVPGFSNQKTYLVEFIKKLHVPPMAFNWKNIWSRVSDFPNWTNGLIVFQYRGKTFSFGIDIDALDAQLIVAAIKRRFPIYKP